jgi:prepilin-type N-terminal cleavage/methylation domain-containing protein
VSSEFYKKIRRKLERSNIEYQIYLLSNGNMNIFFGRKECVDVVRAIGKAKLRDYTPEEDFILGTMLGYDRLIQCRRYLEMLERGKINGAVPGKKYQAFTLIELLIVIGLLGALATLLLSNLNMDRKETLDASIVQKELSDIKQAFQKFQADCVPKQDDYKLMTRYGLEILTRYDSTRGWSFPDQWNAARSKGWRGPYIESEGTRTVDATDLDNDGIADKAGQPMDVSGQKIHVICTPYVNDEDCYEKSYYRIISSVSSDYITELWAVFPSHSGRLPTNPQNIDSYKNKRLLYLNE